MIPRAQGAGALTMAAFLALWFGALARFIPSDTAMGPLARIVDAFAPWLLGAAVVLSLLAMGLGLRRVGGALCALALGASLHLVGEQHGLSLPVLSDAPPDMRVLFFNALGGNTTPSDKIVAAALALDPDVIVFAEASAIFPSLARLTSRYHVLSPCSADQCELLVAARRQPLRFWQLRLNPVWEARYAVAEFETAPGQSVFLVANHLAKPWLSGVADAELHRLAAQYRWLPGPAIVVGDFNAPPWSRPIRQLLDWTGMRGLRWPLATWPAGAGAFGMPIDQVLVRGGPRVVRMTPFGATLGSNHRGFVAEISLPGHGPDPSR